MLVIVNPAAQFCEAVATISGGGGARAERQADWKISKFKLKIEKAIDNQNVICNTLSNTF